MKKFISVLLKTLIFFVGWAICAGLAPIPASENPAIWRLWAELIPLVITGLFTLGFWLMEGRRVGLWLIYRPIKSIGIGIVTGCIWLVCSAGIMYLLGFLRFVGSSPVPSLGIWFFSALLNTMMQELLFRGYLYQMIKQNYSAPVSAVVTTVLFTLMHGGAFEAGLVPVLNVLTMSLLMTMVLEYTRSLLAPVMVHFSWNATGALVLGGVSLAEDYPHLLNAAFSGNKLFSGGLYKIEGSIVVLIFNLLLILVFALLYKNSQSTKAGEAMGSV